MKKHDQRTLTMMENFVDLHEKGYGVYQVAAEYGLAPHTVYDALGEIAEKAGVTRESLLTRPHTKPRKSKEACMEAYKLSAITLHNLIKRGYTLEEFLERFQCTEDQFKAQLKKLMHNRDNQVNDLLQQIAANSKKPSAKPKASAEIDAEEGAEAEAPKKTELELLLEKEAELKATLDQAKARHEGLQKAHAEGKAEAEELSLAIAVEARKLEDMKNELSGIFNKNRKIFDRISKAASDTAEALLKLTEVENRIKELTVIQIMVYADGRIEPLDNPDFIPNDINSSDRYLELVQDKRCEDLTAKEIRILSRVLSVDLNSAQKTEFTFDNARLEEVYRLLKPIAA